MKSTEANMKFPVLAFKTDGALRGFWDLNVLTTCGRRTLRDGSQIGLEIVDGDGRR